MRSKPGSAAFGGEYAHHYMTDTEHNLPSIVDNIKPKVYCTVNIFLRVYDFIQNGLIAMA